MTTHDVTATNTPACQVDAAQVFGKTLEDINPIIVGSEWNADTAHNIRCALEFLADAIPAIQRDSGLTRQAAHGANVILRACATALEVTHD